MSKFGQSIIQPIQVGDNPTTYYVTCGLCERSAVRTSEARAQRWLETHIDQHCRVARFFCAAEAKGLTVGEAVKLIKTTGDEKEAAKACPN